MTADDKSRHDIQNQLAVIKGYADLLLAEVAPDDPRGADFEEIRKAAATALDLLAGEYPIHAVAKP